MINQVFVERGAGWGGLGPEGSSMPRAGEVMFEWWLHSAGSCRRGVASGRKSRFVEGTQEHWTQRPEVLVE